VDCAGWACERSSPGLFAVIPLQYGDPNRAGSAGSRCMPATGRPSGICPAKPERMPQPDLISPTLPASPAQEPGVGQASAPVAAAGIEAGPGTGPGAAQVTHGPQRIPRWLERSELFLRVLLWMYIGLTVCCAPWWPAVWDQNPLFLKFPTLLIYVTNGAVRGLVSGLGLLNLWIAFHDAIRHGTEKQ